MGRRFLSIPFWIHQKKLKKLYQIVGRNFQFLFGFINFQMIKLIFAMLLTFNSFLDSSRRKMTRRSDGVDLSIPFWIHQVENVQQTPHVLPIRFQFLFGFIYLLQRHCDLKEYKSFQFLFGFIELKEIIDLFLASESFNSFLDSS
ncbi:hypothetical protein YN1HA_18230 [Sulfurisphaera ohwakuensis]